MQCIGHIRLFPHSLTFLAPKQHTVLPNLLPFISQRENFKGCVSSNRGLQRFFSLLHSKNDQETSDNLSTNQIKQKTETVLLDHSCFFSLFLNEFSLAPCPIFYVLIGHCNHLSLAKLIQPSYIVSWQYYIVKWSKTNLMNLPRTLQIHQNDYNKWRLFFIMINNHTAIECE